MSVADIQNNPHFEPLGIYARGFLDSSAALFYRADRAEGLVDFAFYPAAYCLRHGLELFIKQMTICSAYEMREASLLYEPGHGLSKAWAKVRNYVGVMADDAHQAGEDGQRYLEVIDEVVAEFHELDPRSTLFRYPEYVKAAKGENPRERVDQPPPFDTVNLSDWAARAASVLEAATVLLSFAQTRTSDLAHERGNPPIHFHETVMEKARIR